MNTPFRRVLWLVALCLGARPDAVSAAEAVADAANEDANVAYYLATRHALVASDKPRDWVLAGLVPVALELRTPSSESLLKKAADAAPDDVLVQWFWAHRSGDVTAAERSAALRRLDPDNAATWSFDLAEAARRKDPAGLDTALKHMAAAKREDAHWLDAARAWSEALRRVQSQPALRSAAKRMAPTLDADTLATDTAIALSTAFSMPAYPQLVRACDAKAKPAPSAARLADCATVGRLMLDSGTAVMSRRTGLAVLRKSGQLGDAERSRQRELDWLTTQYEALNSAPAREAHPEAWKAKQWLLDLQDGGGEIETWKRRLQRHGVALLPPADWVSTRERVDANRAATKSATSEKQ